MQTHKAPLWFALALTLGAGCALFPKKPEPTTLGIYEEADTGLPADRVEVVDIPKADMKLAINPFPAITEQDVQSAELYDTAGGKAIFVRFDPHGTIVLDELTTRDRGKHVVTMINHRAVAAWLVDQRIISGQFLIEGDFTDEEAKKTVDELNKISKKNLR